MSEYTEVELPFLQQLATLGWTIVNQGSGVPQEAAPSLRSNFRQWLLPGVFDPAVRNLNRTDDGREWLTDRQLDDLRSQLLRQPNRTLLEANEAVQALLFKAQVDRNELTGEADPVVRLIDFRRPRKSLPRHQPVPHRHAGMRKGLHHPGHCAVREWHPAGAWSRARSAIANTRQSDARSLRAAAALYAIAAPKPHAAGLREGEPRLFHTNLLLIRTCGERGRVRHASPQATSISTPGRRCTRRIDFTPAARCRTRAGAAGRRAC